MEFQAVIMAAGTGSRMREITSGISKCLLPVGNVPLIMCSLNIVKKAGFSSAIVLVRENEKAKIQSAIEDKFGLKLDIIGIPKNEDWGTADKADFEETVPFKLSILEKNSEVKVYSNLMDAHVYIIKKDLVNFIVNSEHISTLKGEFLPAAVKKQFTSKKQNSKGECEASLSSILNQDWIDLKKLAFELSSAYSGRILKPALEDEFVCFSYIDRDCFCTRVNTLVAYADINKKITKNFSIMGVEPSKTHQYPKSQVDAESVVGENTELLAKASIKQTALGSNCKLSEKVKITNSIIMDNVTFGKECSIQNSIICSNVILEDNCSFKNSVIGPDQTIKTLTKLNSEILHGSEHLMQI
ncbi:Translation initiation factor eIF-2B subunit like protein [Argiope bruennichi]|uniref:Translation initiation factor eIF2B subunit gamma n=1 Tax=Argiope bruennichi TaxID=94029 RepID=A0A8T0FPF4_ARGBR|nr:Translation initiation factor eIF-2B subunit like protein [Argiope bruennichi]